MGPKSKQTIRDEAYDDSNYYVNSAGDDPVYDRSNGWQPFKEYFGTFAAKELPVAKTTWDQMDEDRSARHANEWMWLMWMWARRVRRDLLVLEKYVEDQRAVGKLSGTIPFYADPGDPPPPPDEDR